ncbi:putative Ig domain-containing protein [Corynebacterium sp. HMSC077D03]|uniref:putative Ig domain-containing protein n=1 Tax=Corynebacterium sp. HMSC077D03 TaxID=1739392 RepID=UPI0008A40BDC|nr:putative Ig domain-containing protein [Corynebacterium sp. HMSC077D03]OFR37337.1 hypothetical protein HMPREF2888_02555 [Corynebacterium sp. HMSC077D03]
MLTASGMAAALVMGGVVVVPNLLDNEPAAQAVTAAPGSSEETAINTTVPAGSNRSVNGFVGLQTGGTMQSNLSDPNVAPMSGVKVFAQWFEKDGTASPIYTTTTGADGQFHIGMTSFTDAKGVRRNFDADPNLPEGEKLRIWSINPDTSQYNLLYSYGQEQIMPESNVANTEAGASQSVGSDTYNDIKIAYSPIANNNVMHDLANVADNPQTGSYGQYSGTVFWNQTNAAAGALLWQNYQSVNGIDSVAPDVTVYGSYLSDYALSRIYDPATMAAIGYKGRVRDAGWSTQQELALQQWIKTRMAAEGQQKWIAETVQAKTDANGKYTLQFRGIWGNSWDDRGILSKGYTWHDLADSAEAGNWANGNMKSKHVNDEWMFFSLQDMPGISVNTPFNYNGYTGNTTSTLTSAGTLAGWPANWGGTLDYASNLNFALYPGNLKFDVTPYDSFSNFATAGQAIETTTTGLQYDKIGNTRYQIAWFDEAGNELPQYTCPPVAPDASGRLPSCGFVTDPNLKKTTTYTARLFAVSPSGVRDGLAITQDSFTVKPLPASGHYEPTYGSTTVAQSSIGSVAAPLFDDSTTATTAETLPAPAGTTFKLADGAPTWVKIDDQGTITATPGTDVALEDYTVPVIVTYADGSTDLVNAKVTVTDGNPPQIEQIDSQSLELGKAIAPIKVTTKDNIGVTSVEVSGLPDGVTYDPATGTISGTPSATGASTVNVRVTDAAGNVTETAFSINVVDTSAPVLTSPDATVPEDKPASIPIKVDDPKASVTVEGDIPPGMTWNEQNGALEGTPTEPGIYTVAVSATDPQGNNSVSNLVVTVTDTTEPTIAKINDATAEAGQPITAIPVDVTDNFDKSVSNVVVAGLPPLLTYNPETHQIEGTPQAPGEYPITVTATDAAGNTSTQEFLLKVVDTTAPQVGDIADVSVENGTLLEPISVTSNEPNSTFSASGLPEGVSIDPTTGTISGTPKTEVTSQDGKVFPVTVKVTDPYGNVTEKTFNITVTDTVAPALRPLRDVSVPEDQPLNLEPVTSPDPTAKITVTGLPEGSDL